jgi:hypothetical protein
VKDSALWTDLTSVVLCPHRYENEDPLVRFTEAQLADIRKVTLSRLVCDNCDNVSKIQRSLLDLSDPFL